MNNMSTSEGSSGCESGWTGYLDHTSNATGTAYEYDKSHWRSTGLNADHQNQGTEDLSMISDASSGPRDMYDGDKSSAYFSASASGLEHGKKKQKTKMKDKKLENTYLDDTASSPVKNKFGPFGHSNNQASIMQNQSYSATQHKGKSGLGKHFGFLKSSVSGKPASHKSGGL
ncbi:Angiogenin-2 like [Heracleum sosnowskyi]|uniref:Angiogenin-2 like n=1 Tax=Heracleum sosnowskyi TaxID=360622 RepID=A0AAD8ISZ0_9APIA|nr:Angiogenin-2 like [Heracleum sosnowskyi]